jgi:hypothetical protein
MIESCRAYDVSECTGPFDFRSRAFKRGSLTSRDCLCSICLILTIVAVPHSTRFHGGSDCSNRELLLEEVLAPNDRWRKNHMAEHAWDCTGPASYSLIGFNQYYSIGLI